MTKQNKINVTFRQSQLEQDLYKYAIDQGKKELGGLAGYIKRLIMNDKIAKEK